MLKNFGIKAIVLYGSHARGDADRESDIDVCVFLEELLNPTEDQVRTLVPSLLRGAISLTSYRERDLTAMLEYGSLFLWHLKLEGRILYGKDYVASQFERLKPFQRHHAEIAYHRDILEYLLASNTSEIPNEFDLSLLFTIARNSCMILAHKAGVAVFGRSDCYNTAARIYADLPLDLVTYSFLSKWKSVYERGLDQNVQLPSTLKISELIRKIQRLLEYASEKTG
jgi:predicted nucleotidyltransferase